MTSRKPLSPLRKLALFEREGGVCHICSVKIQVGELWDVEHVVPFALGGADDESNMRTAHKVCHAPKTVDDVRRIAKAKRMAAKHVGIKKPSTFRKVPDDMYYDWKQRRYVREIPHDRHTG